MFTLYHTTPVIEQSTFGYISIVYTSEQQMAPKAAFLEFKTLSLKVNLYIAILNFLCMMDIVLFASLKFWALDISESVI